MMTSNDLPDDLAALEAELARRPKPAPPASLRGRALSAARHGRRGQWSFAASLAAAAVLLLHVMLFATATANHARPRRRVEPAGLADEIRRVVPEMPAAEARRLARLAAAGK